MIFLTIACIAKPSNAPHRPGFPSKLARKAAARCEDRVTGFFSEEVFATGAGDSQTMPDIRFNVLGVLLAFDSNGMTENVRKGVEKTVDDAPVMP